MPDDELKILAEIYERRGLKKETAWQVAKELTEADALGAHVRDELGINELSQAKPTQAVFTIPGEDISPKWDLMYYFEVLNDQKTGWFQPDPAVATPYYLIKVEVEE